MSNKYLEEYICPNCKEENPFAKWEKKFREVGDDTITDIKCPSCKIGIVKEVDRYPSDPQKQEEFNKEDEEAIEEIQNKLDEEIMRIRGKI